MKPVITVSDLNGAYKKKSNDTAFSPLTLYIVVWFEFKHGSTFQSIFVKNISAKPCYPQSQDTTSLLWGGSQHTPPNTQLPREYEWKLKAVWLTPVIQETGE